MKEIFIGSSKEALGHATQLAALLSEVQEVKPLLWTECFKLGDITFLGKFEISDRVVDAKVFPDGSMKIRNAMQSRQRIRLEGEPPQRDGFEPDLRGAREIDLFIQCPPDEPGVLRGHFSSDVGGNIYSKATGKWTR